MSRVIVMPTYIEDPLVTAPTLLTCYTQRPPDLATHADIISDGVHPNFPQRIAENLVDGIYDFTIKNGFIANMPFNSWWFELDLGEVKEFSSVLLVAVTSNTASKTMLNVEVRVGVQQAAAPPDFTDYTFFGHYPGPAMKDEEITITSSSPVSARFISVRKLERNNYVLSVAHVQVF